MKRKEVRNMNSTVKIGIVQMEIISDIYDRDVRKANVAKAEKLIDEMCENNQLDMVVLPEEFYSGSGYGPISMPDSLETVEREVFGRLGEIAKKYNVHIAGELLAKHDKTEFKSNNTGFIINRNGEVVGYQQRFHLNSREEDFCLGGKEYKVFELDFGKVCLLLGSDVLYPEVARNFVLRGAEILISPVLSPGEKRGAEGKVPYLNNLYSNCAIARAVENQAYIVMVNGVGEYVHVEKMIFGESLAAGPLGKIYQAGQEELAMVVDLNLSDKVEAFRQNQLLDMRNTDICRVGA
jgi:predicted amidohydrolase